MFAAALPRSANFHERLAARAPYAGAVGLVERDDGLPPCSAQWARARAGTGGLALVMAEPGGGKTSLVKEFARSLAGQTTVLWGACDPLAMPRPLGPLLDVSDRLGARLAPFSRERVTPTRSTQRSMTICASTRASSSSTTCTGQTRAPSIC